MADNEKKVAETAQASVAEKKTDAPAPKAAKPKKDKVKFTDEALNTILNVPRVFLPLVLKGCVEWARENNVELITEEHMKIINDKRAKEKSKK